MNFQELKQELDSVKEVLERLGGEVSALSTALSAAMDEAHVPVRKQVLVYMLERKATEVTFAELKRELPSNTGQAIAQALHRLCKEGVLLRKSYGQYSRTKEFEEALR
jgi:glutamate-1-semialdehyde aminotransferase